MTGILELFAPVEIGSGIGFLVRWRNRLLAIHPRIIKGT